MSTPVVTLEIDGDLGIVTINNPPVNAVSHAVRSSLIDIILRTNENEALRAVILTCAGKTFVAGADIKEFGKPPQEPSLPSVINAIESARVPWVAAVHGSALGGGLELTLGCRFRVGDDNALFGFPEVNLGLIPGAGGTVRLPRLTAMQDAVNLITSGKPIDASKAKAIGLIDEIAADDLLVTAKSFTRSRVIKSDRLPLVLQPIIEPLDNESVQIALAKSKSRKEFAKTAALNVITQGAQMDPEDAFKLERQTFMDLIKSDQSKALRHLFFAERSVSKVAELKGVTPRELKVVGIVGGGTMGTGIAASALLNGLRVVLIERDAASTEAAQSKIENILDASLSRGIIKQEDHKLALINCSTSTAYSSLDHADIVVEAVFEDLNVKHEVFRALDEVTKPSAILATNTSYLDIATIAKQTKDPSRVVGLHYFSPAYIMKLLEVIRTDVVAPEAFATALQFAKITKKIAVPAGNCKGFIGNRIMSGYRRTGEYLLEDGALPHEVDRAMKNYGFPMGIFEMQDLAGLDIGWAMRKQLSDDEKNAMRYVDIPDRICEAGRFGRKTGSGYYKYEDGKTPERDEWVEALIKTESERKGIARREFNESEIMDSILNRITVEAEAILKDGMADSPEAVDVVMVNGFGFPRWRGGPMFASSV